MTAPCGADPVRRHHHGDECEDQGDGNRQLVRPEGGDAVVEPGGAVGQLFLAGGELQQALVELADAVGQFSGAGCRLPLRTAWET